MEPPPMISVFPALRRFFNQQPEIPPQPEGGSCTVLLKLRPVIPDGLGTIGEHMVWSVIKAIKRGDDVLVVVTSADGRSASRMTLPARRFSS
jgi:hypothetical protein